MEKEIKVIKNRPDFDFDDDSDEIKKQLDTALFEYKKIKKLIDYKKDKRNPNLISKI